jgi:uncharacterized protein YjbI with pentapeptide repeats
LNNAQVTDADLSNTYFSSREPDLSRRLLEIATVVGARFERVKLIDACLAGVRLRDASWSEVDFSKSNLDGCDLEELQIVGAVFRGASLLGALLTGTVLPGADFREAELATAGLADVEWEGADLRGANLRGASFHLGSSRSGLVGSPIACEGSRTGFYTDDFTEQTFKAPEEIRKANLCGADLRGARIEDTDFYLVDLRGAKYDLSQAEHFRHCGAILEQHV